MYINVPLLYVLEKQIVVKGKSVAIHENGVCTLYKVQQMTQSKEQQPSAAVSKNSNSLIAEPEMFKRGMCGEGN